MQFLRLLFDLYDNTLPQHSTKIDNKTVIMNAAIWKLKHSDSSSLLPRVNRTVAFDTFPFHHKLMSAMIRQPNDNSHVFLFF